MSHKMSNLPVKKLGDVVSDVVGGGTPARNISHYWNGTIPWASVKDFTDDSIDLYTTQETISELGLVNSSASLIEGGTVVVCTRMAVGRVAMTVQPTAINQDLKALIPAKLIDSRYLLHTMNYHQRWFANQSVGSTVKGITLDVLLKLEIFLPIMEEQRVIVRILDEADTEIRRTADLIDKLKLTRQGLLHDLLNYGLFPDGTPRNPNDNALFKDSQLGCIPVEWEVITVDDCLHFIDAGKSPSCPDSPAAEGQWGVLKVSAIKPSGFQDDENKVIENLRDIQPQYEVQHGDLLISRANTYELVGLVSYVTNPRSKLMLSDKTLRLNPDNNKILTQYLFFALQTPYSRRHIEIHATGSSGTMKNISQQAIKAIRLKFPKIEEQQKIVDYMNAEDEKIRKEEQMLAKLRLAKKGLMDDLLTGRVRV